MRIAVTTPTGHVGSRVVRLMLQAGVRPRLLLRDPDRLDPATRAVADLAVGDLTDPEYLRAATAGTDALFWVDPTPLTAPDAAGETVRLGRSVADAVRGNGIRRVVFQSSVGAERRHGVGLIDALGAVEDVLDAVAADLGADVLHLRCGYFFSNLLADPAALREGVLTTSLAADQPMPWVDPRDIGDVAAARLLAPDWSGRQVQGVHGPADLTWVEVADTLCEVTGRRMELRVVGDEDVVAGLAAAGVPLISND